MKKLTLAIIALFATTTAFAQNAVGFRGNLTVSNMTKFGLIENITPDFKGLVSGGGAIFLEMPITENFSIQPELSFMEKGFAVKEGINVGGAFLNTDINIPVNGKLRFKTDYIQVPLLAKYHFGDKTATHAYIAAGPAVGYLADAGITIRVLDIFPISSNVSTDIFKPFEFSGIATVGFETPLNEKIMGFVEGRYEHGFSRVLDTPIVQLPVRNRTGSASFGIKINL